MWCFTHMCLHCSEYTLGCGLRFIRWTEFGQCVCQMRRASSWYYRRIEPGFSLTWIVYWIQPPGLRAGHCFVDEKPEVYKHEVNCPESHGQEAAEVN